jgi:hypothetical protein
MYILLLQVNIRGRSMYLDERRPYDICNIAHSDELFYDIKVCYVTPILFYLSICCWNYALEAIIKMLLL